MSVMAFGGSQGHLGILKVILPWIFNSPGGRRLWGNRGFPGPLKGNLNIGDSPFFSPRGAQGPAFLEGQGQKGKPWAGAGGPLGGGIKTGLKGEGGAPRVG